MAVIAKGEHVALPHLFKLLLSPGTQHTQGRLIGHCRFRVPTDPSNCPGKHTLLTSPITKGEKVTLHGSYEIRKRKRFTVQLLAK